MSLFSELNERVRSMRHEGRDDVVDAHSHSAAHRDALEQSQKAGCFYCCQVFESTDIEDWVDDGQCALCPKCGIDSVIGDASGFPVTDKQFLKDMNRLWF